jgi:hypothetical protein
MALSCPASLAKPLLTRVTIKPLPPSVLVYWNGLANKKSFVFPTQTLPINR